MPEFDIVTGIPKQQDPYFVRALSINNGFKHDVASINISLDENIYSSYIQIGPQNFTFTQNQGYLLQKTGSSNQKFEVGAKLGQYDLTTMNLQWNQITDEDNGSSKLVYAYFELDLGYISIP